MLSEETTTIRPYGARLAGTGARPRTVDSRHRTRGRSPSSNGRLLGPQVRLRSHHAAGMPQRAGSLGACSAGLVARRPLDPADRGRVGVSPATVRHGCARSGWTKLQLSSSSAQRGTDHAIVRECMSTPGVTVPSRRSTAAGDASSVVPRRSRRAADGQGDARRRGGRWLSRSADTSRSLAALQFHHVDAAEKDSRSPSVASHGRSLPRGLKRLKCVLLCANCHAEVEGRIPPRCRYRLGRSRPGNAVRGSSIGRVRAVNRRVVGSSPTPGAREAPKRRLSTSGCQLSTVDSRSSSGALSCSTTLPCSTSKRPARRAELQSSCRSPHARCLHAEPGPTRYSVPRRASSCPLWPDPQLETCTG